MIFFSLLFFGPSYSAFIKDFPVFDFDFYCAGASVSEFPGAWGGRRRRREPGCQTDVITEFAPSDSRVYSCLQGRTRRLLRRHGCVAAQTAARRKAFSPHDKRLRSVFRPTPEGSTALVNALQTAQILTVVVFLSFFFNAHLDIPLFSQFLSSCGEA